MCPLREPPVCAIVRSLLSVPWHYRAISDMDKASIELLFSTNLATIKSFVTTMFDSLKSEIAQVTNENVELQRSLEFSQSEITDLKAKCDFLEEKVTSLGDNIPGDNALENRIRIMEDWVRRKNLRITGVAELPNESEQQTTHAVQKLISEKMQVPDTKVLKAFRVNSRDGNNTQRSIVAHLATEQDRNNCLRATAKLKNSDVYVNDDVSSATLAIRRDKMDELKQKRRDGFIAYFSGAKIVSRRKTENRNLRENVNESFESQHSRHDNAQSSSFTSSTPPSNGINAATSTSAIETPQHSNNSTSPTTYAGATAARNQVPGVVQRTPAAKQPTSTVLMTRTAARGAATAGPGFH